MRKMLRELQILLKGQMGDASLSRAEVHDLSKKRSDVELMLIAAR